MSTSVSFLKSKAFKEREENARQKLRQAAKQDLVADLSRLYGDTTFSDVLFIARKAEFQAHTAVLRARAPNFCRQFLPRHASPVSVQTCIQINGLEAAEFDTFLRSAYTEDDFKDYDESSYPWTKQNMASSMDMINHIVSEDEIKGDSASFRNDVDGSHIQAHSIIPSDCIVDDTVTALVEPVESMEPVEPMEPAEPAKPEELVEPVEFEQDDITCTQSHCDADNNISEIVNGYAVGVENAERVDCQLNNDHDEFATDIKSQSDSPCTHDTLNIEPAAQESSHSCAVTLSNTEQTDAASLKAHQPQELQSTNHYDTDLVNGLDAMVFQERAESYCPQGGCDTHTPSCLFNGLAEGVETTEEIAYELTTSTTDVKSVENGFKSKEDLDLTVDHTAQNKSSENELESCSCSLGQDLLQLLISEVGSDVIFLVNGGKVKAHKAILCARSNYFSAMLYGDWIEGKTNEIPLIGVNYNGFMAILRYIYGGAAQVKSDLALICDTLPLVDMYGLEGLREIIISTLKIDKCHMFHKPCTECLTSVPECLEVSELFSLTDLKKSCIKWIAKHFESVLGSKGFATLPKQLQEEILSEIQRNFVMASAIEVLNHCDKLSSCTPLVKWTEPVHVAVSSVYESCLLFITNNFFSLIDERSFHEILKGVGWSVPVLEKILSAVKRNLTIENCCDQLRAILKLRRILKLKTQEEAEECYPEDVVDLVVHLHNDCVKFIRSNLFKVTRSEGWKRLKLVTQREVKEGSVFSGLGDSGDRDSGNRRSAGPSVQTSSRPPARSALQRVGTESRARGLGRGNTLSNGRSRQERPSSARRNQGRVGPAPTNNRPSSGRPSSAQSSVMSGRGKMSSASKSASEKRPLPARAPIASGSSTMSSSFSSSAQSSSALGRGKMLSSALGRGKMLSSALERRKLFSSALERGKMSLSSKASLNEPSAQTSHQRTDQASNSKRSSLSTRETSNGRPSSVPSSAGAIKKAPTVSRPPLPTGNGNNNLSKRFTKEKALSVEGSRVQTKKVPYKAVSALNSRQGPTASCKPHKGSTPADCKEKGSRKELFKDTSKGLEAHTGPKSDFVSDSSEKSENDSSGVRVLEETLDSNSDSNSQLQDGAQANLPGTENSEEASLLLREVANEHGSKLPCDDSLENSKFNDSLELD